MLHRKVSRLKVKGGLLNTSVLTSYICVEKLDQRPYSVMLCFKSFVCVFVSYLPPKKCENIFSNSLKSNFSCSGKCRLIDFSSLSPQKSNADGIYDINNGFVVGVVHADTLKTKKY